MAIKKFYIQTKRPGYQLDHRTKKYFSYGFDFRAGGKRYQERGFRTQAEAEDAIAAIKTKAKAGRHGISISTRDPFLIELFQKKLDTMTGQDRVRAKRVFNDFLSLVPKKLRVTELKTPHFRAFAEKRLQAGVSAATVRRELVPVVACLNAADEFFSELEGYRPPKIFRPKIPKTRNTKTISFHERRAILAWLFDPKNDGGRGLARRTGLFLSFCLATASRPGEIAKLKKSDIDLFSMTVQIQGTKTRFKTSVGERELAITPNMEKILRECIASSNTDFVFTRAGKVTGKMYRIMKAACEANGFAYGRDKFNGITFNRSRHTGITEMLLDGTDIKTAGAIAGQSDQTMTMHYTHTSAEAMKEALEGLDNRLSIG